MNEQPTRLSCRSNNLSKVHLSEVGTSEPAASSGKFSHPVIPYTHNTAITHGAWVGQFQEKPGTR